MKRLTMLLLWLTTVLTAQETRFYVSPSGDDRWSGRCPEPTGDDGPFATVERAQLAIRELKATQGLAAPITVLLRGGVYFLQTPIVFTPDDSGSPEAPITFRSYEGEKAVISGGRIVSGWRQEGNLWVADLPAARDAGFRFQQLFVNGERRYRARTPNNGYFRVRDPMEASGRPFHTYRYRFGFFSGDLSPDWRNLRDVEIVLLHFWSDAHCPIESIDAKTLTVTLATPAWRPFTDDYSRRGARYFVDNHFEGLDAPGEWYLDRSEGKLYYMPLPGEDLRTAEVIAPDLDQLVLFEGRPLFGELVHDIRLCGLVFTHTDWFLPPGDPGDHFAADTVPGAVKIVGGRRLIVEDCLFAHLGTYAVEVRDGSREIDFSRNRIVDIGAGGFLITGGRAGSDSLLKTARIRVVDNRLEQLGRIYFAGIGILSMHASENLITHNELRDLYYTGISVGLEWGYKPSAAYGNVVEYNLIEKAGQGILSDMGGIYTLGISPGTIVRNNLVHDVYTHGYGGWGIYTDEGSSGILIEKNIVYDTKSAGFHQHYGRDNLIRNNVFAFGKTAQLMRSRNEEHRSFIFERNIVLWTGADLLGKFWRGDTTNFLFRNNLYYRTDGKAVRFGRLSSKRWQKRGQDRGSLFADPRFEAPERGDFNLREDSPAFQIGFEPIDITAVGARLWPEDVRQVTFRSPADTTTCAALYYDSGSPITKPLLVVLNEGLSDHYAPQGVPFVRWCALKDWVFIAPQFRRPAAPDDNAAAELMIADILASVAYAEAHALIDTTRIYLVGSFAAGGAALQTALRMPQKWAGVSVWSPLFETFSRGEKEPSEESADAADAPKEESRLRHLISDFGQRAASPPIDINVGLNRAADRLFAAHALDAYNALVSPQDGVDTETVSRIVNSLRVPEAIRSDVGEPYYEKPVLLRRSAGQVRLTIYSGDQQTMPNAALHWLKKQMKK